MAASIVRIRGLPYSATADDVIDFFKDVTIKGGKRGISFPQGPNGRSNGEAFVEIENDEDVEKAIAHHKEHMGRRYIEVFHSDESEMKRAMGWQPDRNKKEYVARLRGLPYDTEKRDIYSFFSDLQIAPNGIGLLVDHLGRCTGDAYVQFTSAEMLARAKEKHLEKIGRRYIEIFDATGMEANMAIRKQLEINQERSGGGGPMMSRRDRGGFYGGPPPPPGPPPGPYRGGNDGGYGYGGGRGGPRPGPYSRPYGPPSHSYDQPGGPPSPRGGYGPPPLPHQGSFGGPFGGFPDPRNTTGHIVHMRGLPFQTTQDEIADFFKPVLPININIHFNSQGRPTGEADAEFATHGEAKEAMKKDREKIGPRYIELFLESSGGRNGGPPLSPTFGGRGGGGSGDGVGQSRNYLPPFYAGGGAPPGGAPPSVGRYNGGGPSPPRGHYDSQPGDFYGGGGDYYGGGPPDDRYPDRDQRRGDGYGGGPMGIPPPDSRGRKRPDDDGGYDGHYNGHREHEGYYW